MCQSLVFKAREREREVSARIRQAERSMDRDREVVRQHQSFHGLFCHPEIPNNLILERFRRRLVRYWHGAHQTKISVEIHLVHPAIAIL